MPACFYEFGGLQCPLYANDICIRAVELCLDITVNLILILSTVLFAIGLGTGTDFVREMRSLAECFAAKGAVNWNRWVQLM